MHSRVQVFNGNDSEFEQIPSEMQILVDAHRNEIPVLIIMSHNCSLLPFDLPSKYAYFYLGLFRISGVVQVSCFSSCFS
jgi:hypothetical protein